MKVFNYIKQCSKCLIYKTLEEFKLRRDTGKYHSRCIDCNKLYFSNNYKQNKHKIRERAKLKNAKNPELNRIRAKEWRIKNPEKVKINREKENESRKTTSQRARAAKNAKNWRLRNPDKVREVRKKQRNRIEVKLADNLRKRLKIAIKNNQKKGSAVRNLGCSIKDLKIYLEKQFYVNRETGEQMTWDNYGICGWHIDHIKPLSSFNLQDPEQLLNACHYTNLQPMWAKENLRKSNKIIK